MGKEHRAKGIIAGNPAFRLAGLLAFSVFLCALRAVAMEDLTVASAQMEESMMQIAQWTRFEAQFTGSADYENPVQDVSLEVYFTSPNGRQQTALGFWDGGRMWKVRFSPDEVGHWTYQTQSSDSGLDNQTGEFECIPYSGDNSLYDHGAIQLSENHRFLTHSDGTPFFWLGDTAWNGVLLSDEEGWQTYLQDRVDKGFTVIQFVSTQWRAAKGDADGRVAFTGKDRIQINPEFYQRMDQRMDALNRHGLVGAPVLIWTCTRIDPGQTVLEDQLIVLARYMVARYGAHQVIWILGGDGNYRGERAERWKRIGEAVFGDQSSRLVTMHPGGMQWVADEFRHEPWLSFVGYQSGHGDDERTLRWLCEGPPAQDWNKEPRRPTINLEPNYEAHISYQSRKMIEAHDVRRAVYWSLLVSPTAGITYGGHGIWSWQLEAGEPMDHAGTGVAQPWHEALHLPGSAHIKHLKSLFSSIRWWELLPAPELLAEQPGAADARRFVVSARAENGSWAILYLTAGTTISVNREAIKEAAAARWFNPRTGEWLEPVQIREGTETFTAPDTDDWVLWIGTEML